MEFIRLLKSEIRFLRNLVIYGQATHPENEKVANHIRRRIIILKVILKDETQKNTKEKKNGK